MNFIHSRIQNKLIAAFLIILLIPLASYIYNYVSASRTVTEIAINYEIDKLTLSMGSLEQHLKRGISDIKYIKESGGLYRVLRAIQTNSQMELENALTELGTNLSHFARYNTIYHHLSYINETGKEYFRINNDNSGITIVESEFLEDKSHHDYFKKTKKMNDGEFYVSNIYLLKEHNEIIRPYHPVLSYATPVFYPNGIRAGIILLTTDARSFLSEIDSTNQDKSGALYLVDKDGYYFINPDSSNLWGNDLGTDNNLNKFLDKEHLQQALSLEDGHIFTDQNLVCYVAFIPPGKADTYWKLLNIIRINELTASVTSFRNMFIISLILGIIVAIAIAVYLARGISGPVQYLTEVANRISHGELDIEVKTKNKDEIGQLADSINRMRASLEAAIIRLRKNR